MKSLLAALTLFVSPLASQFVRYAPQSAATLSAAWIANVRDSSARLSPIFYCGFVHTEPASDSTAQVPFHLVVDSVRIAGGLSCEATGANAIFGLIDGAQFSEPQVADALDKVLSDSPASLLVAAVVVGVAQAGDAVRPQTWGAIRKPEGVNTPQHGDPPAREAPTSLTPRRDARSSTR